MVPLPCATFEETIEAVVAGRARQAMLPIENSTYGRVADIHRLLPGSGLHIIEEWFLRVRICLLANAGVTLKNIRKVRAHLVLLPQSGAFLRAHAIKAEAAADSAGAASALACTGAIDEGVLASELAAGIYNLQILARDIEDEVGNTTRFLIMAPEADMSRRGDNGMLTTFIFQVRNIPAALYKALGGFATTGVNMTKLESYMAGGSFTATQFYADIEGHPDDHNVQLALDELHYFSDSLRILGTYPRHQHRDRQPLASSSASLQRRQMSR